MLPSAMPTLMSPLVVLRPFERRDGRLVASAADDPLVPLITTVPVSGSEEDVHRLQLFVEPWNEASWRAAEAAGYQREGLLRRWERVGDELKDMYAYSLLPSRD